MTEQEDPLVEALKQKQRGAELSAERARDEHRATNQATVDHAAAFTELVDLLRTRIATAAEKAGMRFSVDGDRHSVYLRLGEGTFLQFEVADLGQGTMKLKHGEVIGAAYFGEASTGKIRADLNSCNFLRIRASADAPAKWEVCRFRISGAVAGEKVQARLRLASTPTFDEAFGVDDAGLLYEHAEKADRMMHSVTVEYDVNVTDLAEAIVIKALK